jgi:hypothetical protein
VRVEGFLLPQPDALRADENPRQSMVDTFGGDIYSQRPPMSVRKIQIGQLWKKIDGGDTYLVTRLYSEALSTMVVLRKSGSEEENQIRIKVERTGDGQTIPGFQPAMDDDA